MEKNVVVVGCGYWGKNLVRNFYELGALYGVCDASPEALQRMTDKHPGINTFDSFQDVLANDAVTSVCIAAPAEMHFRLAKEALLAGKHVYVEKPLALTAERGSELTQFAEAQARTLMVGHLLEYHPAVVKLKEIVDQGRLGKIQYIYSNRLNLGKIRREENILWSFAPHDIAVIILLLKEMPVAAAAHGGTYLHEKIADTTVSYLTFASGARAHIFVSWLHPFKEQKLVIVGEKGMAVFDDTIDEKLKLYPHQIDWIDRQPVPRKAEAEVIDVPKEEPLKQECLHFVNCVAEGKRPQTDGHNGVRVLSVLQACQRSLDADGVTMPLTQTAPPPPKAKADFFVHPTAFVDEPCEIGKGTKIWHFVHVLKNTRIGENCILGQNVMVGPDVTVGNGVKIQNNVAVYKGVTLEDYVFCGPSMVFTNVMNPRSEINRKDEFRETLVKRGATLGANCTIVCGHTIGEYAFIGAGAVTRMDVPAYALMVGVPAKRIGWMCRCGVRLEVAGGKAKCAACGAAYEEVGPDELRPV